MCCDTRSNNVAGEVLIGCLDSDNMSCEVKQRTGGIIFTNRGINNQLHKGHTSANRSSWKIIWADAGLRNIRSCHNLSTVLPSWCRDAKCTDSCELLHESNIKMLLNTRNDKYCFRGIWSVRWRRHERKCYAFILDFKLSPCSVCCMFSSE